MSNLTGTNVQPGSGAEKIWWGIVLSMTGIGAFIGIPMIIAGIAQNCGNGYDKDAFAASVARKERRYRVSREPVDEINSLIAENQKTANWVVGEMEAGRIPTEGNTATNLLAAAVRQREARIEALRSTLLDREAEVDVMTGRAH